MFFVLLIITSLSKRAQRSVRFGFCMQKVFTNSPGAIRSSILSTEMGNLRYLPRRLLAEIIGQRDSREKFQ
jgi:hypothetical protein